VEEFNWVEYSCHETAVPGGGGGRAGGGGKSSTGGCSEQPSPATNFLLQIVSPQYLHNIFFDN
jgi:hypothetical protein